MRAQGLLFKVNGVSSNSGTYAALAGVMTALCVAFLSTWLVVALVAFGRNVSAWRRVRLGASGSPRAEVSGVPVADAARGPSSSTRRANRTSSRVAQMVFRKSSESGFSVVNPLAHPHRGPDPGDSAIHSGDATG